MAWYKFLKRKLHNREATQYNDPTIKKKTIKRFVAEGKVIWITVIYQNDVKIKEINHGFN